MMHCNFYFPKFGNSKIHDLPGQDGFAIYMAYLFLGNFSLLELYRVNCSTYVNKIIRS